MDAEGTFEATASGSVPFVIHATRSENKAATALAATVRKFTEEAQEAFENIFSAGTPDSCPLPAIRTLNDFLAADPLVHLLAAGKSEEFFGISYLGHLYSQIQRLFTSGRRSAVYFAFNR
jgi:hypothetical protein